MKRMTLTILLAILTINLTAPEFHWFPVERSDGIWYVSMSDIDILLSKYDIKHSDIVKRQIWLESARLTSFICKANKNPLGMKYAKGRKTTAIGEAYSCAIYPSIEKAIEDYAIWQKLYYQRNDNYYNFLQRIGYATDKDYIKKLKQIKL